MKFEELVGKRLVLGFPGREATPALVEHLRALHAQNLILFERNIESPDQVRRLIRQLEEAVGRRLLVMVDHEGGRIIRFPSGLTRFPDALTVGRTQTAEAVERQGIVEGEELSRLGVRVNLAPCVDVLVPGSDPVIGDRSYGADPLRVSQFAVARIRGLQSRQIAACAKHFPGLGAVPRDPHITLPTVPLDWQAMDAVHLVPFRAAIAAGVAMVMSSHVCYPSLGEPEGQPATFSRSLIHGLLRERMAFRGLILTDDLEMGALRSFGGMGEIAVRSAEAGHDLLLICSDPAAQREAFSTLVQAYEAGRMEAAAWEVSARRMDHVRELFFTSPLPNLKKIW